MHGGQWVVAVDEDGSVRSQDGIGQRRMEFGEGPSRLACAGDGRASICGTDPEGFEGGAGKGGRFAEERELGIHELRRNESVSYRQPVGILNGSLMHCWAAERSSGVLAPEVIQPVIILADGYLCF